MTSRLLSEAGGLRTFAVVFSTGDEAVAGLKQFAAENGVGGAQVTALGAFRNVTVGFFDWNEKSYRRIRYNEQMEVLALTGNIGVKGDASALHAHVVLGRSDGTAHGGHLLEAIVRPTLEVIVTETPTHLRRRFHPETGLHLIDVSA
jgi:predicted DNA-binding protein with PD1-like motif